LAAIDIGDLKVLLAAEADLESVGYSMAFEEVFEVWIQRAVVQFHLDGAASR
jgi:hypothetical protein